MKIRCKLGFHKWMKFNEDYDWCPRCGEHRKVSREDYRDTMERI